MKPKSAPTRTSRKNDKAPNATETRLGNRRLSPREEAVARGIAGGHAHKVVAVSHGLTIQSVATYLARAKRKLGVGSLPDLIRALDASARETDAARPRQSLHVDSHLRERLAALSRQELAVLQHLLRGLSNGALADVLGVTPRTVAAHISSIFRKLKVMSRAELLALLVPHEETLERLKRTRSLAAPPTSEKKQ